MLRRFDEWARDLDISLLRAAFSPAHVAAIAAFVLGLVALSELVPAAHDVLGLRSIGLVSAAGPAWLGAMFLSVSWSRGSFSGREIGLVLVAGAALITFIAASLVVFSSERAALLMGGLLAIAGLAHGYQGRVTPRAPFLALADLGAVAIAAVLAPSATHLIVLLVAASAACVAALLLGTAVVHASSLQKERESLRQALDAQLATERTTSTDELRKLVVDARTRAHDVRNSLMGAVAAIELADRAFTQSDPTSARDVLDRARASLRTAIEITRPSSLSLAPREPVCAEPLVERVIAAVRARFRDVEVVLSQPTRRTNVEVEGGATALERIVQNLAVNACEGDGTHGARRVRVGIEHTDLAEVAVITIEDDGPGFTDEQLERPLLAFTSTKRDGSGLGLFTVDRLASASGGWIERSNLPTGGASLRVGLRLAPAS